MTTIEALPIQLLVRFVNEHQAVVCKAERAPAVLVYPAAHAESIGRQAAGAALVPMPDPAGTVLRAKGIPEQPVLADLEFGKVGAGGNGLFGAETVSRER
ncbi:hypothetical protein GCM10009504_35390 [Pseudomonas laurentiana]|nr:hypothetical protein GCM10009504_35390 [Pseudomonas laurentiana]